ncbi:adhesion G protein-coupled receptor F5 isoform X1 [Prionailurus iriomotensis]
MIIVIYFSQATPNLNLESIVHPLILREHELEGKEPLRQKRAVASSRVAAEEYTVDVEISFENASFLEPIKTYLNSLSFPIQGNSTDQATTTILSIEVTTVSADLPEMKSGARVRQAIGGLKKGVSTISLVKSMMASLQGIVAVALKDYLPRDLFASSREVNVTLRMSVRLNVGFQQDLKNSSSALYRSYKTDLETAFWKGYSILPGFKLVTVTGFRPGSVVVTYEVKTTTPSPELMRKANDQVMRNLNQTYKMDYNSFQVVTSSKRAIFYQTLRNIEKSFEIPVTTIEGSYYHCAKIPNWKPCPRYLAADETKFTIVPEIIFEGDTVTLMCETEVLSSNVSWHHVERHSDLQNNSRFSVYTFVLNNMTSISRLTIYNITQGDAGEYICKLTLDIFEYESRKKMDVTPIRILATEEMKVTCDNNPVSLNCCSEINVNWSTIEWKQQGKINIPGNPETDTDSGCSRYTLKADGRQCPSSLGGVRVTYVCEFISEHGARGSKSIEVTFTSVANLTITRDPISVSEGQNFSIKCISDVSNYDEVYWNTSAGIKIYPKFYTTKRYADGAESVLTVNTVTREWNGTYHCIFRYKNSYSVATKDVTVYPLPLEPNIMVDPLEATIPCNGSHHFKCCIEENEDYKVTFQMDSLSFLAENIIALIKSPYQDAKLPTYLKDLSVSTGKVKHEVSSFPGSLGAIINILDLLSTVPTQVNSEMMTHVLSTVNTILSKPVLSTWKVVQQQQTNQSSQLLDSVERFSRALRPEDSTVLSINQTNVQMRSMVIKPGHPKAYKQSFVFSDSDLWGNVAIENCQLGNLQRDSSIVTVAFPTLKTILAQDVPGKNFANSLVMTTTVSHNITLPFSISMTFKNINPSGAVPRCVFWNFDLANHTGGWDSSGCYVNKVDEDSVSCICDHLTSFSILMSPDSPYPGSLLEILLDIISYIGLCFSILSLAACLVVEAVVWKSVTKNRTSYMRHICIVNIAASLLVADSWFIVAAAIHNHYHPLNKTACVAATFFIHFFYLSVFFWMLTLGLMLFYRLVFILHDASKSIQKTIAFSLGYGCPLVISVITVGATQPQEVYTRKNACWLNWEDTKALLAFVIPALIIVVVNMTIMIVVISKILRPSIGDKPSKQEKSSLFQISKSIGVLTPLLGLTWGFGLATVFQGSNAVFHIIFTLLNAFQGAIHFTLWVPLGSEGAGSLAEEVFTVKMVFTALKVNIPRFIYTSIFYEFSDIKKI